MFVRALAIALCLAAAPLPTLAVTPAVAPAETVAPMTTEELMAATRRDIESETRRAIDEIRKEVADLTLIATEKVTRKSLTPDDHRRLIEEALAEVDFSALSGQEGNGRDR